MLRRTAQLLLTALCVTGIVSYCAPAQARAGGIAATGCGGCHSGSSAPSITISSASSTLSPQQTTTLTVEISAAGVVDGGLYLTATHGTFSLIDGQNTKLSGTDGITHSSPRPSAGGKVTFNVQWTAPSTPGGTDFDVWAVAGNGGDGSRGDGAGSAHTSLVYGCAGQTYYGDHDGDGYGSELSGTTRDCSQPEYFAAATGDCDDNDEKIHPGVAEICNGKDDDCNGNADDTLPVVKMYPDKDGDGHGIPSSTPQMGCGVLKGFAPNTDDCNDSDNTVHPGAKELCNAVDDDCNGRVDEGARLICGVGMCARYGASCSSSYCVAGKPVPEVCNAADDDCDGVVDNGDLCGAGKTCKDGSCVGGSEAPGSGGSSSAGTSPGSGGKSSTSEQDAGSTAAATDDGSSGCNVGPLGRRGNRAPRLALAAVFALLGVSGLRQRRLLVSPSSATCRSDRQLGR